MLRDTDPGAVAVPDTDPDPDPVDDEAPEETAPMEKPPLVANTWLMLLQFKSSVSYA